MPPGGVEGRSVRNELIGWAQLITLVIGLFAFALDRGRKDEQLDQLQDIVRDLASADAKDKDDIRAIRERLVALETRSKNGGS